jgi:hypothetical protein
MPEKPAQTPIGGKYFNKCVVAAVRMDRNQKNSDMKRWITAGGGQWRNEVTEDVTHLICSKSTWEKQPPEGKSLSILDRT